MNNKNGIVFGLANERSYAWYITQSLRDAGANIIFSYLPGDKNLRRLMSALKELEMEDATCIPCDVTSDEQLDDLFNKTAMIMPQLDFIVHSVAYANKEYLQIGNFHTTPRQVWAEAMDISAYSLVAIAQRAADLMTEGGSIVAMSYLGAEKVVPGYNVMGVAKAALETASRYLAGSLGYRNIRVNCISGGPLRTLSAMGVANFDRMLDCQEKYSPMQRNITGDEVGKTALFLLSPWASAITGEVIHVDAGFHTLASFPGLKEQIPCHSAIPV